jgi:hypothetical protein
MNGLLAILDYYRFGQDIYTNRKFPKNIQKKPPIDPYIGHLNPRHIPFRCSTTIITRPDIHFSTVGLYSNMYGHT